MVEFAKLAEDVSLRQKALEELRANTDLPEDQVKWVARSGRLNGIYYFVLFSY